MKPVLMNSQPTDAEVEEVTRYTMAAMSEADAERFESQMANDPAFFYRVAPLLKALNEAPSHAAAIRAGIEEAEAESAARETVTIQAPVRGPSAKHTATAIGTAIAIKPLLAWAGLAAAASIAYVMMPKQQSPAYEPPTVLARVTDTTPKPKSEPNAPAKRVTRRSLPKAQQEVAEAPQPFVMPAIDPKTEASVDSMMKRAIASPHGTAPAVEVAATPVPEIREWPPESPDMIKAYQDFMNSVLRANGESLWDRVKDFFNAKRKLSTRPPGGFQQ